MTIRTRAIGKVRLMKKQMLNDGTMVALLWGCCGLAWGQAMAIL